MNEFLTAALPWVALGIMFALFAVNYYGKAHADKKDKEKYENLMMEGMCLGLCLGLVFGGSGMIYCMLVGTVVGMFIKRKKKENEQ